MFFRKKHLSMRPLTAKDSAVYKALRRKILMSKDAHFFSDSYERERSLSESEWLDWCTETTEHCILGAFAGAELVGIMMVTRQGGEGCPLVEWEAAWLDPRFRGQKLGMQLYEYAKRWSQNQGYRFVAGFIRNTYTPALNICSRLGFVHMYSIPDELWADGTVADTQAYLLDLRPDAKKYAALPPAARFEEAMPFLYQSIHAPYNQHTSIAA